MIEELVGNGESYGLQVNYSFDGAKLRGTGGALKLAMPLLSEHFFVLYGDSFLPVNFKAIQLAYESSSDPALMTVFKNEGRWDNSNVMFVDGRLIEYNKPAPRSGMNYIDYGLGLLSKSVFDNYTTGNPIDLSEIYHQLSIKGQLQGFEVHERFYEIGSHSGLKEAEEYFLTKEKYELCSTAYERGS
jgi:NDP-sugar pyrophosphorylase family protein